MLSTRLRLAMEKAKISQAELARECGVKPPSVSGWLSGKSKFLRGENLLKAARALGVTEDWLATGKGPMHHNVAQNEKHNSTEPNTENQGFTPIKSHPIGLVRWSDLETFLSGDESVAFDVVYSTIGEKGVFSTTLGESDDSMEPEFSPGSILTINPNKKPKSGNFVLARMQAGGALTLKQLVIDADQHYLKPVNPRYPVIHAPNLVVVGVVQEFVKKYD